MRPILALAILSTGILGAATRINDPETFVRDVYRRVSAGHAPPSGIYTRRLQSLFDEDQQRAKGEVGCIDFDFWIAGQDGSPKNVRVTAENVPGQPDRRIVKARFVNETPQEIQFEFRKVGDTWLLDDVESLLAPRWKLSKLLTCWVR